jgi:hypothetical protein
MSKAILPECEYCYLNSYRVMQVPTSTAGNWELVAQVTCDVLDSSKDPIPNPAIADTTLTISGTEQVGMLTQSEIFSYSDDVWTTVSGYMVWAKEEYAGYTG